jgi:hypothetical protein
MQNSGPTQNGPKGDDNPDIREMARQAYSRASLHTYKSDPLHRRKSQDKHCGGKGRGQPNMSMRMNVMLEKIKRDFA